MKKHWANIVSGLRIILIASLFFFIPYTHLNTKYLAISLFFGIILTDYLDGKIARSRFGQITELGKILDPLADKLTVLIYLPFIEMGLLPAWPVAILLARDFIVTTMRISAIQNKIDVSAKMSGKVKTAYAFLFAGLLLIRGPHHNGTLGTAPWDYVIIWIQDLPPSLVTFGAYLLAILCLYSGIDYTWRFSRPKIIV